ncbi:CoxG family protein [Paraburkholderia caribensis]|jgi:carbon monoxide dehydrogenase subunit G|uniref:CoxG family protein n=1 Tax=Paraburkholderia caribensis TaxID=75105 RepID=UPI001CAEB7A8|nr:carbon monoxide dehydrogenase subunit G [Paraburkholderia caribensis]CAG9269224.1 carbon monoxide dehydrogenase G protein [Paraburkholderia caribensis]
MELTETYTLPVPQQRAWEALNDTEILRASIPGCDSIEPDGENAYAVALSAAVGPVKARFKGRMELTEIDAPHTYTIVFEGQGGAAGFGKGRTHVTLEPEGDDATKLTYTATAQVGGKLAQIGSRLVDGAARKLAGEFFRRLGEQLTGGGGEAQAESEDSGDTASPAGDGEAAAEGSGEEPKRKKSWTAWISKS